MQTDCHIHKLKMKRIQAQRKFAQGAPIPQTHNFSNTERRLDVTTNKEESRNIVHSNTPAKTFLDFISFKQIHEHRVPVVVLERLRTNPSNPFIINQKIEELEGTMQPRITGNNFSIDAMCLRSHKSMENNCDDKNEENDSAIDEHQLSQQRTIVTQKEKNKLEIVTKHKERKTINYTVESRAKKPQKCVVIKNNSCNISDVSVDEDTPLAYYAVKKKSSFDDKTKRFTPNRKCKNKVLKKSQSLGRLRQKRKSIQLESEIRSVKKTGNGIDKFSTFAKSPIVVCDNIPGMKLDESKITITCDSVNLPQKKDVIPTPDETIVPKSSKPVNKKPLNSNKISVQGNLLQHKTKVMRKRNIKNDQNPGTKKACVDKSTIKTRRFGRLSLRNTEDRQRNTNRTRKDALQIKNDKTRKYRGKNKCSKNESRDSLVVKKPLMDQIKKNDVLLKKFDVRLNRLLSSDCRKWMSSSPKTSQKTLTTADSSMKTSKTVLQQSETDLSNTNRDSCIDCIDLTNMLGLDEMVSVCAEQLNNFFKEEVLDEMKNGDELDIQPNTPVAAQRSIENNVNTAPNPNINLNENFKRPVSLAPVFTPTAEEFSDPVAYFDSIMPEAQKFGICKVVPPADFTPTCYVNEEMVFNVTNQYISRLFSRWGPGAKEMATIKAYLASQSVVFKRAPLYEGMEVNLPKLYQLVQRHGGLKKVIERKRWSRVAEEMRFMKGPNSEKKLDQLYVKYLLPYDTLSSTERGEIMSNVERIWSNKYRKMVERALNPLHRQTKLLVGCESSEDEDYEEDAYIIGALAEAEECVVPGRKMNLATFKKVAITALDIFFSSSTYPTPTEVEKEYWRLVSQGTDHVCVNSASIDTGAAGYGFTKNKEEKYGDHPWNLKMLANNTANILSFLGPVLGVTVPTLHLGMVFSTSCWHRDPHGLPWMEFMHSGPPKIWYGIPDEQSLQFRHAVEVLCPTSCQNKSMWLPSDIAMIPPELLLEHDLSLSRVEQNPGEYIIVFPKAYSCSISTGYTISESVYFASMTWLKNGMKHFMEAQLSCEPTMISVESLLVAMVKRARAPPDALHPALMTLVVLFYAELKDRNILIDEFSTYKKATKYLKHQPGAWNVREQDECEFCRKTLFLSRVRGLTKNNTSLCLQHAIQIIKMRLSKKIAVPNFELDCYFTCEEMERILSVGWNNYKSSLI